MGPCLVALKEQQAQCCQRQVHQAWHCMYCMALHVLPGTAGSTVIIIMCIPSAFGLPGALAFTTPHLRNHLSALLHELLHCEEFRKGTFTTLNKRIIQRPAQAEHHSRHLLPRVDGSGSIQGQVPLATGV